MSTSGLSRLVALAIVGMTCLGCGAVDKRLTRVENASDKLGEDVKEFGKSLEKLGESIEVAVPGGFFTRLLRDTSSSDPKVRKAALEQVERLFGTKIPHGTQSAFSITAQLEKVDHPLDFDMFTAPAPNKVFLERWLESRSWSPARLDEVPDQAVVRQTLQARRKKAQALANEISSYTQFFLFRLGYEARVGGKVSFFDRETQSACTKIRGAGRCEFLDKAREFNAKMVSDLTELAMLHAAPPLPPEGNTVTETWGPERPHPILFVVVPDAHLQANPDAQIKVALHVTGDATKLVGQGRWFEIPMNELRNSETVDYSKKKLRFFTYNLVGNDIITESLLQRTQSAFKQLEAAKKQKPQGAN